MVALVTARTVLMTPLSVLLVVRVRPVAVLVRLIRVCTFLIDRCVVARRLVTKARTLVAVLVACRVNECILLVIIVKFWFTLLVWVVLTVVPSVSRPARLVTE